MRSIAPMMTFWRAMSHSRSCRPCWSDPDRLTRFRREAQVLASLNHPHIAAIYGIAEQTLVMELVEGATLAERLNGPLPLEEALHIAGQMADALERPTRRASSIGISSPPTSSPPDGTVKVLDFGLAKAFERALCRFRDVTNSPTLTLRATQAGLILGTAAYMSPEQASGKPVDKRADIWSFGVVLFEMLTGKQLFEGETVSHTLADVLRARSISTAACAAAIHPSSS